MSNYKLSMGHSLADGSGRDTYVGALPVCLQCQWKCLLFGSQDICSKEHTLTRGLDRMQIKCRPDSTAFVMQSKKLILGSTFTQKRARCGNCVVCYLFLHQSLPLYGIGPPRIAVVFWRTVKFFLCISILMTSGALQAKRDDRPKTCRSPRHVRGQADQVSWTPHSHPEILSTKKKQFSPHAIALSFSSAFFAQIFADYVCLCVQARARILLSRVRARNSSQHTLHPQGKVYPLTPSWKPIQEFLGHLRLPQLQPPAKRFSSFCMILYKYTKFSMIGR